MTWIQIPFSSLIISEPTMMIGHSNFISSPSAPLATPKTPNNEKENRQIINVHLPFADETPRQTPTRRRTQASPIPKASMSVQASPFPTPINKENALGKHGH